MDAQLGEPPESKPRRTMEWSVQPSSRRDVPGPQCVLPFPTLRDQGLDVGGTLPDRCRLRDEQPFFCSWASLTGIDAKRGDLKTMSRGGLIEAEYWLTMAKPERPLWVG